jgi:CheY-like chemotaxis protein
MQRIDCVFGRITPEMSDAGLGTILLIEDEITDAALVAHGLEKSGVQNPVVTLRNADEALAYLEGINEYADRIAYPLPILILLDLKLPGMPGLQLLKWIRTRRDLRLIPVVILTASEDDADVKNAYDAGANSYLRKAATTAEFYRLATVIQHYWLKHNVPPPLVMRAKLE